jgi:vacuolar-type H+-ATPase subunit F/Vma7
MRLLALGRPEEIRGFALAGVATIVCQTAQDAEKTMAELGLADAGVGLLIVPRWIGQAASQAISQIRSRQTPPVVLVLDEPRVRV